MSSPRLISFVGREAGDARARCGVRTGCADRGARGLRRCCKRRRSGPVGVAACGLCRPGSRRRLSSGLCRGAALAGCDVRRGRLAAGDELPPRRRFGPSGDVPGHAPWGCGCVLHVGLRQWHAMQMLRTFWDAALELDEAAPDEGRVMRYCTEDELAALWGRNGLAEVETTAIDVRAAYANFDDYWVPFTLGVDQAGHTAHRWTPSGNSSCRTSCFRRLAAPDGPFTLRSCLCRARPAAAEPTARVLCAGQLGGHLVRRELTRSLTSRSMRSYGMGSRSGNLTVALVALYGASSCSKASSAVGIGYSPMWCFHAAKYTKDLPLSVICKGNGSRRSTQGCPRPSGAGSHVACAGDRQSDTPRPGPCP